MSGRPAPAPRPNLPAPTHQCLDSGQTRESTEIPRHWPRQVSAASAAPVTSYMLSFAQPIACPMRSAPFAAPCPRAPVPRPSHTLPVYPTVPCVLVVLVHCFTFALTPSSRYLIHRGTDMLDQDGLGFSARRSPTASRSGCHAMPAHHHHGSCSGSGSSHGHSELAQNFLAWRNP